MIPWRPIAELPDELKADGVQVLIWTGTSAFVASYAWDDLWQPEGLPAMKATHFAEITPP